MALQAIKEYYKHACVFDTRRTFHITFPEDYLGKAKTEYFIYRPSEQEVVDELFNRYYIITTLYNGNTPASTCIPGRTEMGQIKGACDIPHNCLDVIVRTDMSVVDSFITDENTREILKCGLKIEPDSNKHKYSSAPYNPNPCAYDIKWFNWYPKNPNTVSTWNFIKSLGEYYNISSNSSYRVTNADILCATSEYSNLAIQTVKKMKLSSLKGMISE